MRDVVYHGRRAGRARHDSSLVVKRQRNPRLLSLRMGAASQKFKTHAYFAWLRSDPFDFVVPE